MQTKPIEVKNGKYRWTYEMSLFKNPDIFILVSKVWLGTGIGVWAFIALLTLICDGFSAERLADLGKTALIMFAVMFGLLVLGYLLYALIMGGYYVVEFEMDDKTLVHTQTARQAKKADKIGEAAVIAGALAHNRGAMSAGRTASSRMSSTTELQRVSKVVVNKKRSVIKLQSAGWNEVYADGDDFGFAEDWIRRHTPDTAKWTVKG